MSIEREFKVNIPDGTSEEDEELLIEAETDRQVEKLLDDIDPFA